MVDPDDRGGGGLETTAWNEDGEATIEAAGGDLRSVLEGGLRAALLLALGPTSAPAASGRSAPVRGEGEDAAALFVDLLQDLLEQIAEFGGGLDDVTMHGVLRREGGGYVGWGYVTGTLDPAPVGVAPRLAGWPTISENDRDGVVLRASLIR